MRPLQKRRGQGLQGPAQVPGQAARQALIVQPQVVGRLRGHCVVPVQQRPVPFPFPLPEHGHVHMPCDRRLQALHAPRGSVGDNLDLMGC